MSKTVRKILLAAFAVLFFAAAAVCLFAARPVRADGGLQEEYRVGDSFTLPEGTVTHEGREYPASGALYLPDGTRSSENKIVFEEAGRYKAVYSAKIGGKTVREEKTFDVLDDLYTVTKDASSVSYGAHAYAPEEKGLVVSLTAGAAFEYNEVIDLSEMTKDDILLSLFLTPENIGSRDFKLIKVTLTDVYDEKNTVTVTARSSEEGVNHPVSYMMAAGSGQPMTGYEWGWNKLHQSNNFGYAFNFSYYGLNSGKTVDEAPFEIRFDYAEREIHGALFNTEQTLVADLDSPQFFDTLWGGFTTGEVRLKIEADGFLKSSANFVITQIAGQDLSRDGFYDEGAPEIDVDLGGYGEADVPDALENAPYAVFPAVSRDPYCGELRTDVQVFYNYRSENRYNMPIYDGAFVPDRTGRYTIVYTATDYSGNRTEKLIDVYAVVSADAPAVNVIGGAVQTAVVGESAALREVTLSGGTGRLDLSVKVMFDGEEIAVENNVFIPTKAGMYTVEYTVTDYIGRTAVASYEIRAEVGDDPFIYGSVSLPRYFIAGKTYKLPQLAFTDYASGAAEVKNASVSVNGAAAADNTYTAAGSKAVVVYLAESARGGTASRTYEVPVVDTKDGGGIDLSKYFVSADTSAFATKNYVTYTTDKDDASMSFVNALFADGFTLEFNVNAAANRFTGVDVVLEDYDDPDARLTISFTGSSSSGTSVLKVNGGESYTVNAGFNGGGVNDFMLRYDAENNILYADNDKVEIKLNGFGGFESGRVWLTLVWRGVSGAAAIDMKNVCGQPITSIGRDAIKPNIQLPEDSARREIGETYILRPALAYDVLDPEVKFTLTVKTPSGKIVTAKDGTALENADPTKSYEIELTEYGVYNAQYTAEDTAGRSLTSELYVRVTDNVAPVLELDGKMPASAEVGDVVVVPYAKASDNVTAADSLAVYMYLVLPDGTIEQMNGNSFVADRAGVFAVRYICWDEEGNFTMLSREIVAA